MSFTSLRSVLTGACVLAVGLGGSSAVLARDTITIGSAISMTGKYSTSGSHTKKGYDLAVKMINNNGGVTVDGKQYDLKIKYYDDESTPARGTELAERLIQQDGVKYILGPYSSGMTKAMAPVAEKHNIPLVEANGSSRSLFTQGYDYLFAVLTSADQYLTSAVALAGETADDLDKKPSQIKLAMAVQNDPFSKDVRAGVKRDAKKRDMSIVIDDQLPRELNDMSATLTKVKALKPDVLVVSGHAKGAATGIRQIEDTKTYVPMLAMTHCDSAQIIKKFGDGAEYTLCASQWAPSLSYSDDLFGSASDFADRFEKAYGYRPPYQAAESAAAVEVYADAFHRAGSLDPKKVRDALDKTDMRTFYGPIRFDDTGKNTAKPMVLYQVQDGEYKVVAPTKYASAELIHPAPKWSER